MSRRPAARWRLVLALGVLALAACRPEGVRSPPPDPADGADPALQVAWVAAQSAREAELAARPDWGLEGRLAVSVEGDGGSGRLDWRQQGGDYRFVLSAPVSRRSWRLERRGGVVELEGLEDGPRVGADAEALLREAIGWDVPVEALAAWVRGARAPGTAQVEYAADGLPRVIAQAGWRVEYREWRGEGLAARPRRIHAVRGGTSVRLVVDRWLDAPAPATPLGGVRP
jgi:outer membrane lipoprotein LolB